jgi:universal stress protein E
VILAALDPTHMFAKPAALDPEILHFSATLADALHGTVHAVHGYVPVSANLSPAVLSKPGELEKVLVAAAADAFDALAKVAKPLGIARDRLHVVGRHPTDAIEEVAMETGCQIVALGSISRSGVDRLLIGNTAEALIDRVPCDVLVVKPPAFRHKVVRASRGAHVIRLPISVGAQG